MEKSEKTRHKLKNSEQQKHSLLIEVTKMIKTGTRAVAKKSIKMVGGNSIEARDQKLKVSTK